MTATPAKSRSLLSTVPKLAGPSSLRRNNYANFDIINGKPKEVRKLVNWEEFVLSMEPRKHYEIQTTKIKNVLFWAGRYGIQIFELHEGFMSLVWRGAKGGKSK